MNAELEVPVSKMLVLEQDEAALEALRRFCDTHRIQGLRVGRNNLLSVLKSNIDLGGLLVCDRFADGESSQDIVARTLAARPDLPVFMRRSDGGAADAERPASVAHWYTLDDLGGLADAIERLVFAVNYPRPFVRGLLEISATSLKSQFPALNTVFDSPYVVRDQLIHGELFTLIPLESSWCRGFMSVQAQSDALQHVILAGRTPFARGEADDFRALNSLLGEITNLVWGAFKARFFDYEAIAPQHSQVPIVVNQVHRYISFGSNTPQLCLRATLTDPEDDSLPPLVLILRFVFNLAWVPERYRENDQQVESLVASGELEMF